MLHFCRDMIKKNEGGREEILQKALLGEKGGIMSFKTPQCPQSCRLLRP